MRAFIRAIVLLPLAVIGCQAIAGIEDRHFDALDASASVSPACKEYCDNVLTNCTVENEIYKSADACHNICALLPEGMLKEAGKGNTVACRNEQATNAGTVEPGSSCPLAGPGGGGICGSDCDNYCTLYSEVCADFGPWARCKDACAAMNRSGHYSSQGDYGGDTLDCRLVHLSVATTGDKIDHCKHAGIAPTTPCVNDDTTPPSCADYCHIITAACGVGEDGGSNAQYDSLEDCLGTCSALPPGKNSDNDGLNTIGCRHYHSYNGFLSADMHCPHAGPTGDAVCVDKDHDDCDAYCAIVKKSCPDAFGTKFGTDSDAVDKCVSDCGGLKGAKPPAGYSIGTATGNTFQCRVHAATHAFTDPTTASCDAAFGGDPCN
jgi:hypothetical protein